ncbi:zinc-dependent metalloprotease [Gemmatimonas sp. UBA7669]|uniref:zinc-dependent metalloprotease n=1 Tax=Gemmatimonas sp. UBA7669 TaxID=1946568 RepID=UPI0025BA176B|nr:zinc-dependent metalloprotease [Gemmatimonas sp. UBA7669]
MRFLPLTLAAAGMTLGACAPKPKPAPAPTPTPNQTGPRGGAAPGGTSGNGAAQPPAGGGGGAGGAQAGQDPQPRPYASIVTGRAVTKNGVFKVHQVGSRLFFEIPRAELGKDFVIVSTLAGTPNEIGLRGTQGGNNVVRFERRDHRILLREARYRDIISDTAASQRLAAELIGVTRILAALNVEAYGPDSAAVVEVTRLFTGGVPEYTALGARAQVDAARSYVEKFSAYARNVNVTAVQTFTPQGGAPGGGPGGGNAAAAGPTTEKYTFSVAKLPENPMMPRLLDERVGYFGVTQRDFSGATQRVETKRYIGRWRLECSDQKVGNLCVPKKPITYYLDPATPAWLKPWIRKGIEEWQPAFEAAGFHKGIVAAEAPANDPDFSGEDATVSMVRWLPSATENAVGPSLRDPRTGEILDADVQTYLNVMNLTRSWYFTQVGHLDPRAQKLPFPDTLTGRLLQYVTAHEVGHTLGFPHNFKASSMYPVDSVRSRTFVKKMGHTPTLMDYSRFNYVAQPEDNIDLEDLIPKVGPYDHYAVMWGYTPIANARTPEAELPTLDKWARMQDSIPWYRFSGDNGAAGPDPGEQSEAVGDADAVKATTLGVKNLKRTMAMLEKATAWKEGSTFDDLEELYGRTVGQWATEMGHVARIVGGQYKQEKRVGQSGPVFTPVEPARQKAAVQYLLDNAYTTPTWLLDRSILSKLEPSGSLNRVGNAQVRSLGSLLSNDRLQRMLEFEALAVNKRDVYPVASFLADVRAGLWKELSSGAPIDAFRRRLQRVYLETMNTKINPPAPAPGGQGGGGGFGQQAPVGTADFRPILKAEMRALDASLAAAIGRTSDTMTRAHLQDARDQIKKMLSTEK